MKVFKCLLKMLVRHWPVKYTLSLVLYITTETGQKENLTSARIP